MWSAACKDFGIDCPFYLRSEEKGEVVTLALGHARVRHQYEVTPQLVEICLKTIREA